jgi:hypothetical protein
MCSGTILLSVPVYINLQKMYSGIVLLSVPVYLNLQKVFQCIIIITTFVSILTTSSLFSVSHASDSEFDALTMTLIPHDTSNIHT